MGHLCVACARRLWLSIFSHKAPDICTPIALINPPRHMVIPSSVPPAAPPPPPQSQQQLQPLRGMSSGSGNSTDMAVSSDSPKGPLKGLEEPASSRPTKKWVLPAAAAGLLLLGLGIGLAIGLPLAFSNNNKRRAEAVELSAGYGGMENLKGTTRTYYLAADPIDWDYAPAGKNLCNGKPFDEDAQLYTSKGIGSKYKKAVYRQYTDDSFKVCENGPARAPASVRLTCFQPPAAEGHHLLS